MTEKTKVTSKNGVVRHVPVKYNKLTGGAVTISVSIQKSTAGLLNDRAKELNVTKSKLTDNILRKELENE